MADERLTKIEKRNTAVDQWGWKTVSTVGLMLVVWYLNGINSTLKVLSDEVVKIKLNDSANQIIINTIKSDVEHLKQTDREHTNAINLLERASERRDQQLKQLTK